MDGGTALRVRLGLAQHLVGDGDGIAFAEEEVAERVDNGVALGPAEVAVRGPPGRVAQVEQEGAMALGTTELTARSTLWPPISTPCTSSTSSNSGAPSTSMTGN